MKKIVYYGFSILFLLSISSALPAQDDYAVMAKGDTIRGRLTTNLFGKTKLDTGVDKIIMEPTGIAMYHRTDRNETHCSRQIPGTFRPVFLTLLVDGPIRMYNYIMVYNTGRTTYSTTTWYAEKDNIPLGEIKAGGLRGGKQDRKDFFRSLIADNPGLAKKFDDDDKFSISFLQDLIVEYNKQAAEQSH